MRKKKKDYPGVKNTFFFLPKGKTLTFREHRKHNHKYPNYLIQIRGKATFCIKINRFMFPFATSYYCSEEKE